MDALGPGGRLARHRAGDDAGDEGHAAEPVDAGDHGGRARTRRSVGTCAATCVRCTTSSPTCFAACKREGGIHPERDADTEAWIFVAGSLLVSVADRLGGPLAPEDFEAIKTERLRWLTGEARSVSTNVPERGVWLEAETPRHRRAAHNRSEGRRAIHSPVGQATVSRAQARGKGGTAGKPQVSPPE